MSRFVFYSLCMIPTDNCTQVMYICLSGSPPLTHNVSSDTTDEVYQPHPEPANGALYLDSDVQLDGHDDDDVDHTEVDEDGEKPPPELVGCGKVRSVIVAAHVHAIESTDILEAVHLQAVVQVCVVVATASITLLRTRHEADSSDGHTARVEIRETKERDAEVSRAGAARAVADASCVDL